jgi:hypothetical protein
MDGSILYSILMVFMSCEYYLDSPVHFPFGSEFVSRNGPGCKLHCIFKGYNTIGQLSVLNFIGLVQCVD